MSDGPQAGVVESNEESGSVVHAPVLEQLGDEIAARVPQPLDPFEIAAVIESMGITDSVAREDYGVEDVFELAGLVFPSVRRSNNTATVFDHDPADPHVAGREAEKTAVLEAAGRGLLALAPLAILLLTIQGLGAAGWSSGSVLALSLGLSAAMLLTSGPILAMGRRTAIYLGFDYRLPARRFVAYASLATALICTAAGGALLAVLSALDLFDVQQRLILTGALVAFAVLWLLASTLTLAGHAVVVVATLAAGLAIGTAVGLAMGSATGIGAGYASCLAALALFWPRAYAADRTRRLALPSPALLVLEAAPYVLFGSAFALFLLEPHVLGWIGKSDEGRAHAFTTLELSLTLALPPVLIASGFYEQIMRSFWTLTRSCQESTDGSGFCRAVGNFHASRLRRYGVALAVLSIATVIVVEFVVFFGGLQSASQLVFLSGVVGFFLLGIGQFNCLFMLSLSGVRRALDTVLAGVVALTVLGVPLILIDFRLAAPALVAGGAVFAVAAIASCRQTLDNADYHYATTL